MLILECFRSRVLPIQLTAAVGVVAGIGVRREGAGDRVAEGDDLGVRVG